MPRRKGARPQKVDSFRLFKRRKGAGVVAEVGDRPDMQGSESEIDPDTGEPMPLGYTKMTYEQGQDVLALFMQQAKQDPAKFKKLKQGDLDKKAQPNKEQ